MMRKKVLNRTNTGMIFVSCYLTDFSYFPLICILKITGHSQNRSKMELFKGDVDGFSYFSFTFSYFIFLSESSL